MQQKQKLKRKEKLKKKKEKLRKRKVKGREEAEAKAEIAEAKAEVAEAKADTYKSLLLQIKRGELPLSALDGIELESVAGPSRKQ